MMCPRFHTTDHLLWALTVILYFKQLNIGKPYNSIWEKNSIILYHLYELKVNFMMTLHFRLYSMTIQTDCDVEMVLASDQNIFPNFMFAMTHCIVRVRVSWNALKINVYLMNGNALVAVPRLISGLLLQ